MRNKTLETGRLFVCDLFLLRIKREERENIYDVSDASVRLFGAGVFITFCWGHAMCENMRKFDN